LQFEVSARAPLTDSYAQQRNAAPRQPDLAHDYLYDIIIRPNEPVSCKGKYVLPSTLVHSIKGQSKNVIKI